MHKLTFVFVFVFVFVLVLTVPAFAEMPESQCTQPRKPHVAALPAGIHGISVQCGSNSINQTIQSTGPDLSGTPSTFATPAKNEATAPSSSNTVWGALIAAISGLIGALAAGAATLLVANRNAKAQRDVESDKLRANVVAAERLRWLQDIRARLAKVFQYIDMQYDFLKRPVPVGGMAIMQAEFDSQSKEIMEQVNMITLMLNPGKSDQAVLRDALQKALTHLRQSFQVKSQGSVQFNDSLHQEIKQTAFDAMTTIGVTTWGQVKSLR